MQSKVRSETTTDFVVRLWDKNSLRVFAFLALTVWVAHFFYFRHFGFYEDDYGFEVESMSWSLPALLNHTRVFVYWEQGRPIHFFLSPLFSFIGSKLGGRHITYVIGFVIVTVNAFLFYSLFKRVSLSETLAVTGALAFCLFPADTTHTFLVHALGLQTSLTFLLIASLCYLLEKKALSYLLVVGCLLTYESPFMVFWAIPLLKSTWDRSLLKELIGHIAILSTIILVILVIRTSMGEERAVELASNILHVPLKIGAAIFIGPIVSLGLFLYGPIRTTLHWNLELTIVFAACLVPFMWMLYRLRVDAINEKCSRRLMVRPRLFALNVTLKAPTYYSHLSRLILAAVVMLCLAYAFSFTHFPPLKRYGRLTSVHLAAAFGGALLFGCICSFLLSLASAYRVKRYAVIILAIYLSSAVAYRFSIQQDFKQAWQNQRWFWTSAIRNLSDMADETVIFVSNHDLPTTRYVMTNSWADPIILRLLFRFPGHWKTPPRLFVVPDNWTSSIVREGDLLKWRVPIALWPSHWEVLPDSNVILLEMESGQLVRKFDLVNIQGLTLRLKPMTANAKPDWEKRPLYSYLIDESSYQPLKNSAPLQLSRQPSTQSETSDAPRY